MPENVTDVDIYEALTAHRGNVGAAAQFLSLPRNKVQDRVDKVPALASLVNDLRDSIVDKAEQNVFTDVEKGDPTASRFVLSTLGRSRGYMTGVAGSGKDGSVVVEIRSFSDGDKV